MSNTEASIADHETEKDTRRAEADGVLDDHAAGFRPATRRVGLRPNLHLYADLEALIEQAEALDDDDPRIDEIEAEFFDVKARFEQERAVVLRAISSEVVRAVSRQAVADGLDPSALADRLKVLSKPKRPDAQAIADLQDEAAEAAVRLNCRTIAAMVVDDDEVDEDWLFALSRSSESEYLRLCEVVAELQSAPERVAPDFSRARSATRRAG